jgi:hypothetical protein
MRSPARRIVSLAFAICCLASPALAQISTLRITEAMSSSGVGGTADWWEVTNYGSSAVDITGWKVDDSSFTSGSSVALNGITSISAGESVAFLETTTLDSGTVATLISSFRTFWGGSAASAQIGYYAGSGIGLSSNGDGLVMFSGTGAETTPRVTFGAATTGASFYYGYDAAGDPTTSPNTNAIVSTVGTLGGQITFASATISTAQNIGSPGTAVAVPEPSSVALLAIGAGTGVALVLRRTRRRS